MKRLVCFCTMAVLFIPATLSADEDTPKAAATRKVIKTKKITVEWKDELLKNIMKEISEEIPGLFFRLDLKGGVSQNSKLSYTGKDKTVEEILNSLFEKQGLGYFIISGKNNAYDGSVQITKGDERGYEKGKEPK